MKIIKGFLDGIPLSIHVTETVDEYREGARIFPLGLGEDEAILFNFRKADYIVMENSGVKDDLSVLYFHRFTKWGVVEDVKELEAMSNKHVSSSGIYEIAIEVKKSFCTKNSIKKGSILVLKEAVN